MKGENLPCHIMMLHRSFYTAWTQLTAPTNWQQANKGRKREHTQYRGILLLSHVEKMYAKIIGMKLTPVIESQLAEEQTGFRRNRNCTDAIFVLKQLFKKYGIQ